MRIFEILRYIVLIMCGVAMAAVIAGAWEQRCIDRTVRRFLEEQIRDGNVDMHVVRKEYPDEWEDDGK